MQAKKDRVEFETEISKHESHLGSLPHSSLTAWPPAVQRLVHSQVQSAVGDVRKTMQADAMAALEESRLQKDALKQELRLARFRASDSELCAQASDATAQQLRDELREQETALQEQISSLQLQLQRLETSQNCIQGSGNEEGQLKDLKARFLHSMCTVRIPHILFLGCCHVPQ